jgi:inhibitor of cysteine peptidase
LTLVKRTVPITLLLVAVMLVAGCGPKAVELGADDNGREIELARGQTLVVSLESNPTTGYRWEVVELEGQLLQPVGEAEYHPRSDAIGAPGVEILRFKALNAGRTPLKLVYHRPWEKDAEPLETFSLQVVVR